MVAWLECHDSGAAGRQLATRVVTSVLEGHDFGVRGSGAEMPTLADCLKVAVYDYRADLRVLAPGRAILCQN